MQDKKEILNKTNILKLLSDPSRYSILEKIIASKGNLCVNELANDLNLTPSAASHQLSKLELAGLVLPIRRGQQICYTLNTNNEAKLIKRILNVINAE